MWFSFIFYQRINHNSLKNQSSIFTITCSMKLACINNIRESISLSSFEGSFLSLSFRSILMDSKRFYYSTYSSSVGLNRGFLTVRMSVSLAITGTSKSDTFNSGLLQYLERTWVEVSISAGIFVFACSGRGESTYLWGNPPFINSEAPNNNSYFWEDLYFSN